ncbi:hypothetical protein Taro_045910 [Colocasia esculenta]|uniref:Uncharacterized protein n=1 Tax=Colocasia esculenta TaxID=4460 RepID=A0A843X6Y1_COLES|nr:hypothetical protein [Colocasia esculenta]
MYGDSANVDDEVLQGTLNVIGRLSLTPEKRLEAELQLREKRQADDTTGQIDVDALFDNDNLLQSWVEVREEIDDPIFNPADTTWVEGILEGDEPRDPEFKVSVKRPKESSSKGKQLEIVEDTEEQLEPTRYSKSDSRPVTPRMVKPPPSLRRTLSGIYMTKRANATARNDLTIEKKRQIYIMMTTTTTTMILVQLLVLLLVVAHIHSHRVIINMIHRVNMDILHRDKVTMDMIHKGNMDMTHRGTMDMIQYLTDFG